MDVVRRLLHPRTLLNRRTLRYLGWGLTAATTAQVAAVAGVVTVDELRKRRSDHEPRFPSRDPETVEVGPTAVTTYTRGATVFDDMIAAIDAAERLVLFESYIFKGDETGQRFKDALIAAAERGVSVYVIFDGFANLVVDPRFYRFPEQIHVLRFPALRRGMVHLDLRHLGRDHRKVLVVDSEIGFVGGYNVGDMYATSWRDTHVRLEGPAVWEIEDAFVDFWNEYRPRRAPRLDDRGARAWDSRIEAARNAPSRMLFPVRGLYLGAMERATTRIWITQAYFIPDGEILAGLVKAARRGVDVRVIVPEYSNHVVADWVARGYFHRLLEGGVQIWLYRNAMVHAKTATVDGIWSTVGTANIDRLSMIGNYEINVAIFSPDMAAKMEEIFTMDQGNSRRLTMEEWASRGPVVRVVESLLAPLYPLL